MQVGLTCGKFMQITPFTFNEHNLFIPLSYNEFFPLLDLSRGEWQKINKHEKNGIMYEKIEF